MRRLLLILLAISAPASADDFCADLPGLATGTCVVPPGTLQMETVPISWSLDRSSGQRENDLDFGNTELRLGIAPGAEIQASWSPLVRQVVRGSNGETSRFAGVGDATIGAKVRLMSAYAPVVVGLYPLIKLPTARSPIGNGKLEASLLVPVDLSLSKTWSLNIMPEADWIADDDGHGHHGGVTTAAALTHNVNDRLSVEADVLHSLNFDPGGHTQATGTEIALIWLPRKTTQLDLAVDRGLAGTFPDWRVSAGVATRF